MQVYYTLQQMRDGTWAAVPTNNKHHPITAPALCEVICVAMRAGWQLDPVYYGVPR